MLPLSYVFIAPRGRKHYKFFLESRLDECPVRGCSDTLKLLS